MRIARYDYGIPNPENMESVIEGSTKQLETELFIHGIRGEAV